MGPASLVAWGCESLKYTDAFATACLTFVSRYSPVVSFIFVKIMKNLFLDGISSPLSWIAPRSIVSCLPAWPGHDPLRVEHCSRPLVRVGSSGTLPRSRRFREREGGKEGGRRRRRRRRREGEKERESEQFREKDGRRERESQSQRPSQTASQTKHAVCIVFCVGNCDASAETRELCLLKKRVNSLSALQNLRQNRSSQRKCETNFI